MKSRDYTFPPNIYHIPNIFSKPLKRNNQFSLRQNNFHFPTYLSFLFWFFFFHFFFFCATSRTCEISWARVQLKASPQK